MRTHGVNTSSLTGARLTQPKGVRQSSPVAGVAEKVAPALYLHRENIVREHPRLAVEMRDAQQDFGAKELGLQLLGRMSQSIALLEQNVAEKHRSRSLDAEFDRLVYSFRQAGETKIFGRYVLASNFRFNVGYGDYIYFHVPGLNLERERDENEVVSLFLAGKLVSLPMRRVLGLFEQRREIVATFGRQLFDVKFLNDGSVVIGMLDADWRMWDRSAMVSGWGFRFASGSPIQIPVIPSEPVMQQVLDLRPETESLEVVLGRVREAISQRAIELKRDVGSEVERIRYLSGLVGSYDQVSLRSDFLANPRLVLSMVGYAFNGPSRANVVRMIQGS